MVALTVSLHEVILAACMTAVALAILGTTVLILKRSVLPQRDLYGPRPLRPCGQYADVDVLKSWFGALQDAPAPRPAYAPSPAMANAADRAAPGFDAGQPEHRAVERRRRERRA